NRQASRVWVVPADGSAAARPLTCGPADSRPRWSPDGGRLAFLGAREREWAKDLFVLTMAGGEARRVAALPRGITEFAWSPDGTRFCLVGGPEYPADPDRGPAASPDEARQRYLERPRHVERFRYRMDGQGLLDDEARQLWVVPADGDEPPRMLTEGASDVARPAWAPDGRIAFLGNREPDHDRSDVVEIYAVGAEGGEVERLTCSEATTTGFAYGPRGELATLRTDDASPFGGRHVRCWIGDECLTRVLDRTSAAVVLVDTAPSREPQDPVWAGGYAFFEVADGGSVHVYRARPGGP